MSEAVSTMPSARVRRCAVCKIDLKGRFVVTDEETENLFGFNQFELFGKPFTDFLIESDREIIEQIVSDRARYETFFDSTWVTLLDYNDDPIPAIVTISLNFDAGVPVNYQVIIIRNDQPKSPRTGELASAGNDNPLPDISEPLQAVNTCELQDNTMDLIGAGMLRIGPAGLVVHSNDTAKNLIGRDLLHCNFDDAVKLLIGPNGSEITETITALYNVSVGNADRSDYKFAITLPSGKNARLIVVCSSTEPEDQTGFLILLPETEIQVPHKVPTLGNELLTRMLEQAHSSVAAAMSVWEELSHENHRELSKNGDINLLSLSRLLAKIDGTLTDIRRSVRLVETPEVAQLTDLDLLVNQVLNRVNAVYPGVGASFRMSDLPRIVAPRKKLEVVLGSIINNSIKFATGGSVDIEIGASVGKGWCRFEIIDNGPGIPAAMLDRVFEYSYRSLKTDSSVFPGSGSSLAVTRRLIESIGGRMKLTSEKGEGTRVTLWIPIEEDAGDRDAETA